MRSLRHASPAPRKMAARRVPPFHVARRRVGASCQKTPPPRLNKVAGAQRPRCILTHGLFGNRVSPHALTALTMFLRFRRDYCRTPLYVASFFNHLRLHKDEQPTDTRSTRMETINTPATPNTTSAQGTSVAPHARVGLFRALRLHRAVVARRAPAAADAVVHQSRPLRRQSLFSPACRAAVVGQPRRRRRLVAVAARARSCRGDCYHRRHAPSAASAA